MKNQWGIVSGALIVAAAVIVAAFIIRGGSSTPPRDPKKTVTASDLIDAHLRDPNPKEYGVGSLLVVQGKVTDVFEGEGEDQGKLFLVLDSRPHNKYGRCGVTCVVEKWQAHVLDWKGETVEIKGKIAEVDSRTKEQALLADVEDHIKNPPVRVGIEAPLMEHIVKNLVERAPNSPYWVLVMTDCGEPKKTTSR